VVVYNHFIQVQIYIDRGLSEPLARQVAEQLTAKVSQLMPLVLNYTSHYSTTASSNSRSMQHWRGPVLQHSQLCLEWLCKAVTMLKHTRWSFHAHITDRILSEVLCWPSTTLTLFYGHGGMDLAQYCDYCCIHELLAGGLPPPLQAATLRAHPSSVSCWWCWQDVLRAHARDELGIDLDNYSNPLQVTSIQQLQ